MPMQVRFINQPRLQVRVVQLPGGVIDVFGRQGHVVAENGDYTASQITNVPSGSVTAVTVQGAIDELATGAGVVGAALTKTDDTNVTATLGGTPTTALLRATSITLGWTGTLDVSRGGIGTGSWAGTNSLVASGTSGTGTIQVVANSATTGTVMRSNGAAALPSFGVALVVGGGIGTSSWAGTNSIVASGANSTGTVQIVANSATTGTVMVSTGAAGLPGFGVALVVGGGIGTSSWAGTNSLVASGASGTGTVQIIANSATTGTVLRSNGAAALPSFGVLSPVGGGTGTGTWTTNTIILGGTTATATFAQVAHGSSGTVLTSQGAGVLPIWQSAAAGSLVNPTKQVLTTAAGTTTYTRPTSPTPIYLKVRGVAGGGGGGGSTAGGGTGGTGGTTTFSTGTAFGGVGGGGDLGVPGNGGTSTGGSSPMAGNPGGLWTILSTNGNGGQGGGSAFAGGAGKSNGSTAGSAGTAQTGGGGAGGGSAGGSSAGSGGGGGGTFEMLITTPAATYTFAVGAGGTAGIAGGGTGPSAGGAGGSGVIIVEEYYQ